MCHFPGRLFTGFSLLSLSCLVITDWKKKSAFLGRAMPLTPLVGSSWRRAKRAAVSGNPPRGPPWRQHIPCRAAASAAERAAAELMYSTTEPASVLSCSEPPAGTAQGRRGGCDDSKGSAGNSALGDPSGSLLPLCFKSMQGLYSSGVRIFQKLSEHLSKWHLLGNWIGGKKREKKREEKDSGGRNS